MKLSVLMMAGMCVLGTVALASPRLTASPEVYDFGVAPEGVVIQYQVALTNTGTSTLNISNVVYNCVCTSYSLPKRSVAPNESVPMTVRFNTRGYGRHPQPVSQTLTIHSNDPTRPQLLLVVRGRVREIGAHEGAPATLDAEFYVLVDLRPAAAHAQGHLLGAVNIPFADLTARMDELPRNRVIYLYDETGIQAVQAGQLLRQSGFLLARSISGGLARWWQLYGDLFFAWAPGAARTPPAGTPFYGTLNVVDPSQLARNFLYIVDIRSPEAFAQAHFLGADNVQLATQSEIATWAASLPRAAPGTTLAIWIVDADGSQATPIAQYLQGQGFAKARALLGGIAAWRATYGDTLLYPSF